MKDIKWLLFFRVKLQDKYLMNQFVDMKSSKRGKIVLNIEALGL